MSMQRTARSGLAVGMVMAMAATGAVAQHADVEIEGIENGQIVLHTDEQPVDHATGNAIFEAEFGENAFVPHETDDPGFVTEEPGPFAEGTWVQYRTHGTLSFWDGADWGPAEADTRLHVLGNFFEDSLYTSTGLLGDAFGLIGVADGDGGVHSHIDFCVEDQALDGCPDSVDEIFDNAPATGAYLIEMSLFGSDADGTETVGDSDPFFIAFNNGLEDEDFEAGIDALTAVPLPAALWLFGSGLLLGVLRFRRRRAAD